MLLVPATELEAVNLMLGMIGEQPVNSLQDTGIIEVSTAQNLLHATSRELQNLSLECNTEQEVVFTPDNNKDIKVPTNVLFIDPYDKTKKIIQRGQRLYDKDNHTYAFEDNLKCDVTYFLAFEELPSHVREYVLIRAGRKFAKRILGSADLANLSEQDELNAKVVFMEKEVDSGDYSMFDSYGVARVLNRRTNSYGYGQR